MLITDPRLLADKFRIRIQPAFAVTGTSQVFLQGDISRVWFGLSVHPVGSNLFIAPSESVIIEGGFNAGAANIFFQMKYADCGLLIGNTWSCITDTLGMTIYVVEVCYRPQAIESGEKWSRFSVKGSGAQSSNGLQLQEALRCLGKI